MTNKAERLALAERCEAGTADEQRALLELAYRIIFGNEAVSEYRQPDGERGTAFLQKLSAQAYESAAMTLIPAGCAWNVEGWPTPSAVHNGKTSTAWVFGAARVFAATPALALTAASLRATAAQMGDE